MFNFMNFDNIGASIIKESDAFKQIQANSKIFNTNLVTPASDLTARYKQINSLYVNENDFSESLSFGTKRQHNLTATKATTSTFSTFLDRNSRKRFLDYTLGQNTPAVGTDSFSQDLNTVKSKESFDASLNTLTKSLITQPSNVTNAVQGSSLLNTTESTDLLNYVNNDTDRKKIRYPLVKLYNNRLNNKVTEAKQLDLSFVTQSDLQSSETLNYSYAYLANVNDSDRELTPVSENQIVLNSEKSTRLNSNLKSTKSDLNLSNDYNTLTSNLALHNLDSASTEGLEYYNTLMGREVDISKICLTASIRPSFDEPFPPLLTNRTTYSEFD